MYNISIELYIQGMIVKPSELRRRLFELIDHCLDSGEAIDIPRNGGMVRLSPISRRIPIASLPRRPEVVVEGDSLDTFSPAEWSPD